MSIPKAPGTFLSPQPRSRTTGSPAARRAAAYAAIPGPVLGSPSITGRRPEGPWGRAEPGAAGACAPDPPLPAVPRRGDPPPRRATAHRTGSGRLGRRPEGAATERWRDDTPG